MHTEGIDAMCVCIVSRSKEKFANNTISGYFPFTSITINSFASEVRLTIFIIMHQLQLSRKVCNFKVFNEQYFNDVEILI